MCALWQQSSLIHFKCRTVTVSGGELASRTEHGVVGVISGFNHLEFSQCGRRAPRGDSVLPSRHPVPVAARSAPPTLNQFPSIIISISFPNGHNLAEERSDDSQNCVVRILCSIGPSFRISFGVKHGKDDDVMLAKGKEDFIRESPEKCSARGLVDERMLERIPEDTGQCRVNGQKELRAKPLNPGFIPFKGFAQFGFRLRPNDQLARHTRLLMRVRTSLQGDPSPGFL